MRVLNKRDIKKAFIFYFLSFWILLAALFFVVFSNLKVLTQKQTSTQIELTILENDLASSKSFTSSSFSASTSFSNKTSSLSSSLNFQDPKNDLLQTQIPNESSLSKSVFLLSINNTPRTGGLNLLIFLNIFILFLLIFIFWRSTKKIKNRLHTKTKK